MSVLTPSSAPNSPFHAGEQAMQEAAGARERSEALGQRMIRDHLPDQHRAFYPQLPFVVAGSVDAQGYPWATLLTGEPGFIQSPNGTSLRLQPDKRLGDPVMDSLALDAHVGLLGIELPTRRRNRVNGRVQSLASDYFTVEVDQAFGNCPQYIQSRDVQWVSGDFSLPKIDKFSQLPSSAVELIRRADTFFVASSIAASQGDKSAGVDVSHRGGRPGFVRVQGNTLTIPDYRGNKHFNTLGNFVLNPKAGLVFPDFAQADLLQVVGDVTLLTPDHPDVVEFEGAERGWQVTVTRGQYMRGVLPFRFGTAEASPRNALTGVWSQ